jgi:hypothetical protein
MQQTDAIHNNNIRTLKTYTMGIPIEFTIEDGIELGTVTGYSVNQLMEVTIVVRGFYTGRTYTVLPTKRIRNVTPV